MILAKEGNVITVSWLAKERNYNKYNSLFVNTIK